MPHTSLRPLHRRAASLGVAVAVATLGAVGQAAAAPSPSPTATPAPSASPSSSAEPSATVSAEPSASASAEPTGTPTPDPTRTPTSAPATEASVPPTPATSLAQAPQAVAAETADERIHRALGNRVTTSRFGTSFTGYVADAESGEWIWSRNARSALIPASNTKLVTAHNALMTFGTGYRFTTYVRQGSRTNRVLVQGVGDPSLSSAQLDVMAKTVASTLRAKGVTSTRVYVDDDRFPPPSMATGWKSTYVPADIGPVRALMRDQRRLSDSSADVGRYFANRLAAHGMSASYYGRGDVAGGAAVLARSQGERMDWSVSRMLLRSDNEIAEALNRLVGWKRGTGTTWSGARSAQRDVMNRNGLPMSSLYDGSGLSRSNKLSSKQLATLLVRTSDYDYSSLWPMRNAVAMPTAGRTGTLKNRFDTYPSQCADGKVWAKTGSLNDVTALSGYTYGTDGRKKVFSFLVGGRKNTDTLEANLDMLAASVNGCY